MRPSFSASLVALVLVAPALSLACKSSRKDAARKVDAKELELSKGGEDEAKPAEAKAPVERGIHAQIGRMQPGSCELTICFAGPGPLDSPANVDLSELCRPAPGVIRRCEDGRCRSLWPGQRWRVGLDALISALDQNGDGRVDDKDRACTISAAGWSTGADQAARELPGALLADGRVANDRVVVDRLVAVAPRVAEGGALEVAKNVRTAFVYRHTKAPEEDCSRQFEGGPWLSPPPVCAEGTTCYDYDYSLEPQLAFKTRRGARSGSEIGHCNMMAAVAKVGRVNLVAGLEIYDELAPRHADGTPGGRKRPEGPLHPDPPELPDRPPEPD